MRGAEGSRRRRAQSGSEKLPRKKCELADCDARLKATAQRKEYTPRNEKPRVVKTARPKAWSETEPKGQMPVKKKCERADCDARPKTIAQRKEYTPRNEKLMVVEAARQKARNETEPKGQMLIPTDEVETQGPDSPKKV